MAIIAAKPALSPRPRNVNIGGSNGDVTCVEREVAPAQKPACNTANVVSPILCQRRGLAYSSCGSRLGGDGGPLGGLNDVERVEGGEVVVTTDETAVEENDRLSRVSAEVARGSVADSRVGRTARRSKAGACASVVVNGMEWYEDYFTWVRWTCNIYGARTDRWTGRR